MKSKKASSTYKQNGIVRLGIVRWLSCPLLSAISFKLVQDFLFRLLDVPTAFSTSVGVELLSVPPGLLDVDWFLFPLFPSSKLVSVLTNGVTGLSEAGIFLANAGEANSFVSLVLSLLLEPFSKLAHFWSLGFAGSDFEDVLALEGHISFICPFGVPLFIFQYEQKWHLNTTLFCVGL